MALSLRAEVFSKPDPSFLFWDILQDLWHPDTNPNGFVNLGLAENSMMHGTLKEYLQANFNVQTHDFTYGDGKTRLRTVLARFFNRYFHPHVPLDPSHFTVTNGCSAALEHLSWSLGNPGDYFLLGKPYYYTFVADLTYRMSTHLKMVDFEDTDPFSLEAVANYERQVAQSLKCGHRIAGIILTNPHNPLGRCYSRQFKIELMKVCQKYQIHLISDEIYALSTFSEHLSDASGSTQFESVLAVDTKDIIDPALVHVLWGISKDFGANGLRLGTIISQSNAPLHAALVPVGLYSSSSSITEQAVANFLDDDAWVDNYITANRKHLAQNYSQAVRWAEEHNVEYSKGTNAAFFLWVNLGKGLSKTEQEIMDALLRKKVFLAPGSQFGSEKPGWFRIVFSVSQSDLNEGLKRIINALRDN